MPEPRLFLDADGVLADFDEGARRLLGMTPRAFEAKNGRGAFWKRLANAPDFYGTLPEMPDARLLFEAVEHLGAERRRQQLAGDFRRIDCHRWIEAIVAIAATFRCILTEMAQQDQSATTTRLDESSERV